MVADSKLWAIIPAAGTGSRLPGDLPKQYLQLAGKPVIAHGLERLLALAQLQAVYVPLHADDRFFGNLSLATAPRIVTLKGGSERAESVLLALEAMGDRAAPADWVLVHDAARPCLSAEDLAALLERGRAHPVGAILACPVVDTVKRADISGEEIVGTVDRSVLWRALTPQLFPYQLLRSALEFCRENALPVTDEASAVEHFGQKPLLVRGSHRNIKITYPDDLALASFYLREDATP